MNSRTSDLSPSLRGMPGLPACGWHWPTGYVLEDNEACCGGQSTAPKALVSCAELQAPFITRQIVLE